MTSECLNEVQTSFHKSNWTRSEFPLPLVSSCGEGVETLFILTRSNRCSTKGIATQVVTWFPESPFLSQVCMECSSISLFVTMKEMDIQRTYLRTTLIPSHSKYSSSSSKLSFRLVSDNEKEECRTAKWTFIVFYSKRCCCCRLRPPNHFGFQELSGGHVFLLRWRRRWCCFWDTILTPISMEIPNLQVIAKVARNIIKICRINFNELFYFWWPIIKRPLKLSKSNFLQQLKYLMKWNQRPIIYIYIG